MSSLFRLKKEVYQQLETLILNKIALADKNLKTVVESRNNETKSSAGDKYETARAQMQIEQQQVETARQKAIELKLQLPLINLDKMETRVKLGSLVETNFGVFLIWYGIGKIEIENEKVYAISLASPLGKALNNKIEGEQVQFLDKNYQIKAIA